MNQARSVVPVLLIAIFLATPVQLAHAAAPASVPYTWKSVQMVGGGFVDGIVFHPTPPGLRYARTDIGGAYRWDDRAKQWVPLLDWLPYEDVNLMGVESIAVDPGDANRLYLACGMYTADWAPDAAMLRSDDQGRTFARTNLPFKMGGNEDGRGNGERLMVDPNDGRILYFGSRHDGLWRSSDRGASWAKVETFPNVEEPMTDNSRREVKSPGIIFILFDPRSGTPGKGCSTIYAGASVVGRSNFFRSIDHGINWVAVAGAPTNLRLTRAALASDGTVFISYGNLPGPSRMTDGAIWKFSSSTGAWTDITPQRPDPAHAEAFGYDGIAVDPQNPKSILASTFYRPGGDELFRSTDAGATWHPIFNGIAGGAGFGIYDYSGAPYTSHTPIHWLFDVQIDPFDSNHALFTTGYGGWETFDLTNADAGKPTHWSIMAKGIEETVAMELISPTSGAHLISAIGDYGGFVHWDLDRPSAAGNFEHPRFGTTSGVAVAVSVPQVIVRVGRASGSRGGDNIGYSLDGGKTWQPATPPKPTSTSGSVAVSVDGRTWVWTPQHEGTYFTRDRGVTWTASTGLPPGIRVIADSINPQKFYAIALFDGKLFTSTDGAASFTQQPLNLLGGLPRATGDRGDNRGGQDRLYAMPGKEGDLWIAAFDGLYHSADAGKIFSRLDGSIEEIHAFGFGKGKEADQPAIYLVGKLNHQRGVYRSDDEAKTWVRINDDQHQYGLILQICGDPRVYGRVYLGTHGRGVLYGDPAE
jgi:photosystem II stability/assembly factor-like uncharacterized protein